MKILTLEPVFCSQTLASSQQIRTHPWTLSLTVNNFHRNVSFHIAELVRCSPFYLAVVSFQVYVLAVFLPILFLKDYVSLSSPLWRNIIFQVPGLASNTFSLLKISSWTSSQFLTQHYLQIYSSPSSFHGTWPRQGIMNNFSPVL